MRNLICGEIMRIVGVDEAGRGPVLGPLVVGLLSIPNSDENMLIEQNISDSKHHSAKKTRGTIRLDSPNVRRS